MLAGFHLNQTKNSSRSPLEAAGQQGKWLRLPAVPDTGSATTMVPISATTHKPCPAIERPELTLMLQLSSSRMFSSFKSRWTTPFWKEKTQRGLSGYGGGDWEEEAGGEGWGGGGAGFTVEC